MDFTNPFRGFRGHLITNFPNVMVLCSLRGVGGLIPTFCSCPVKLFPLVCVRGVSCSFSVVQTRVALACSLHTLQFSYTTVSQ